MYHRNNNHLLYLILFLHQTTTPQRLSLLIISCILFCFYIKPQLTEAKYYDKTVVSYFVSTSNHNDIQVHKLEDRLYLILFLHQTTTAEVCDLRAYVLYLILFLHQTTTL